MSKLAYYACGNLYLLANFAGKLVGKIPVVGLNQ